MFLRTQFKWLAFTSWEFPVCHPFQLGPVATNSTYGGATLNTIGLSLTYSGGVNSSECRRMAPPPDQKAVALMAITDGLQEEFSIF